MVSNYFQKNVEVPLLTITCQNMKREKERLRVKLGPWKPRHEDGAGLDGRHWFPPKKNLFFLKKRTLKSLILTLVFPESFHYNNSACLLVGARWDARAVRISAAAAPMLSYKPEMMSVRPTRSEDKPLLAFVFLLGMHNKRKAQSQQPPACVKIQSQPRA